MRFNFTRLSLLKFFILNKKRTRRTLLVINFSIFLTIFAGTSAIISLYVENKINEREYELLETQRSQNYFHQMRSMFPVFHGSIDNSLMFDRMVNRFNLFISSTNFGDKIISSVDTQIPFTTGNAMPIGEIPSGILIHNIELKPGK